MKKNTQALLIKLLIILVVVLAIGIYGLWDNHRQLEQTVKQQTSLLGDYRVNLESQAKLLNQVANVTTSVTCYLDDIQALPPEWEVHSALQCK